MIFDSHSHTKFSADSEMLAEDAISRAESLNLGIIFTEHYDYNLPGDLDFTFNAVEYMNEYKKFRSEKVKLGVEIGLRNSAREQNKKFLEQANFDLVIGSIHVVDDIDIYNPEFFADKDKLTAYRKYFTVMAEEVAVADFDVLGHIDYICRTAPYKNSEIEYEIFKPEIDEVLKIIVERGKILELNTRRLNSNIAVTGLESVYKRYKEFGGEFITIGSDAHVVEAVGANFDVALKFAQKLNLKPVNFTGNRKFSPSF